LVELDASDPSAIVIPHGVAHGFLSHTESIHVYAVSHPWNPRDEFGCRWDDPELGIPWPQAPREVSERDRGLPTLVELRALLVSAAP
jgi:dTDP-4-dehydrorhamnose 3,5-epimerase-like enzyme